MKPNQKLREFMNAHRVNQIQLAKKDGINRSTLNIRLSEELPELEQNRYKELVLEIVKERGGDGSR